MSHSLHNQSGTVGSSRLQCDERRMLTVVVELEHKL